MIVLNSNKELIRVENWADIEARPGFTRELDPANHELATIIGRYAFADKIRCGLSNCHTPHIRGYIVCTKDGLETNIGKDCGKNYFGVDFETLARQFDQDITDKEHRERLWSVRFRSEEIREQVRDLRARAHGADWVFRSTRPLVESGRLVPILIVRKLAALIKTRQDILTIEREATEDEIERLEGIAGRRLPRPHYIEEQVARIDGMEALYAENDLRKLLVLDIEEELNAFDKVDIDSATSSTLGRWNRWASTILPNLEIATAAIDAGRRLLKPNNLEPFVQLLDDHEQIRRMRGFLKALEER